VPGGLAVAMATMFNVAGPALAQNADAPAVTGGLEEIVVTATRREESVRDVPISIAVFSEKQMDVQGIRGIDDIARLAPGVTFTRTANGFGNDLGNSISIRGISSTGAGASTTGVYIDETPIQVGAVLASGNFADSAFPKLFDVQRVEVLRGPQGTLFGSGSEGGTVRFITPAPSLTDSSAYVRSEIATTQYGAPSYEIGAAGGAPIIDGKLGFRASVWTRRDGGYVDWVDYYTGSTLSKDNNWTDSTSARLALAWQVTDNLLITPSFYFQNIEANGSGSFYLPSDGLTGTAAGNAFKPPSQIPVFEQPYGDVGDGDYVDIHQVQQWGKQQLTLPALKIEYSFDKFQLVSNTSYYERKQSGQTDFGFFQGGIFAGQLFADPVFNKNPSLDHQDNRFVVQEVRLQSTDADSPLKWVVGAYYSRTKTSLDRRVVAPGIGNMLLTSPNQPIFHAGQPDARLCATADECELAQFGVPLVDGLYPFIQFAELLETQKAGFAQVDYAITDHITATAGVRYSKMTTEFDNKFGGPTQGRPFPQFQHLESDANATTPKYMVSYKSDGGSLFYASASKGFRAGGANAAFAARQACLDALSLIGLSAPPESYDPDSVWSYELGTKFALDGGNLQVDASIFQIDWDDQIRNISLAPSCTQSFTANIGTVQSRGFDLAVNWRATDSLLLSLNGGYQEVKAKETINTGGVRNVITEDDYLTGTQPQANAAAQYTFNAMGLDSYARVDYSWIGMQKRGALFNPLNSGYNVNTVFASPETKLTNLRVGTQLGGWDVSLFVNNLFNEQPILNRNRSTVTFGGIPTGLLSANTLRPRTVGLTATMRF
jgi:iron complex outermembrane recepter protein